MTKPRSDLLGSLGKLFSIFKKVVDHVLALGGGDEEISRLDTDDHLAADIAAVLCGQASITSTSDLCTRLFKVSKEDVCGLQLIDQCILQRELLKLLQALSDREFLVFMLRFGAAGGQRFSIPEVSNALQFTRAKVRELEEKVIQKMSEKNKYVIDLLNTLRYSAINEE